MKYALILFTVCAALTSLFALTAHTPKTPKKQPPEQRSAAQRSLLPGDVPGHKIIRTVEVTPRGSAQVWYAIFSNDNVVFKLEICNIGKTFAEHPWYLSDEWRQRLHNDGAIIKEY